eukprot:CAMPEP_0181227426 /NCGR_PEP_ID=MMETSP1096-20121128/32781_1 /TAXON_ID=156174 ORGANISM="Chrysochromulina ericina, Strain CCMP281" /NCGR_SAMPLE_ID=MMETSP1096 /ASSEMBLY_ACC=CAM_ASM_000453 /LENGTH=69 /DNA_ID=CAMNT_0023320829 /DNA_START=478 /DNA_END=687 /DNA_ORIENTATION=+
MLCVVDYHNPRWQMLHEPAAKLIDGRSVPRGVVDVDERRALGEGKSKRVRALETVELWRDRMRIAQLVA